MAEIDKRELLISVYGEDHPAVVFGTFHGYEKSDAELEAEYLAKIKPALRKKESALFATKWFDYRFMNPVMATWLFAHMYEQAYRLYFVRVRLSLSESEWKHPVSGLKKIFETRHATGFVSARQWADERGIPYDFMLWRAMRYAQMREWQNHPMPSQLYNEELGVYIEEKWEKCKRETPKRAIHPAYKASRYVPGNEHQEAYYAYLRDLLGKRWNPKFMLADLIATGQMPESYAAQHLNEILLRDAKDVIEQSPLYKSPSES